MLEEIYEILKNEYKDAKCALNYKNPFELLVLSRLSAQCKDSRVNSISYELFRKFPDIDSFANADTEEIEKIIYPCGLFKSKAKNLKDMCIILKSKFNSEIPNDLDKLQLLPGIGRKTSNLIMAEIFNSPSIIVDTHVSRITRKLGIHNEKNPYKIELILQNLLKKSHWISFCHCLVFHGREICISRSPKCSLCCIKKYCKFYKDNYDER